MFTNKGSKKKHGVGDFKTRDYLKETVDLVW